MPAAIEARGLYLLIDLSFHTLYQLTTFKRPSQMAHAIFVLLSASYALFWHQGHTTIDSIRRLYILTVEIKKTQCNALIGKRQAMLKFDYFPAFSKEQLFLFSCNKLNPEISIL